jgi:hypothetical protein
MNIEKTTTSQDGGNALTTNTKEASKHNDEENGPSNPEEGPEAAPTERRSTRARWFFWGGLLLALVLALAVVLGCVYGIDDDDEDSSGDSSGRTTTVYGHIVDIHNREIYRGTVVVNEDRITKIERDDSRRLGDATSPLPYILPGFIDSHVHVESSLLVPSEFARLAVRHGTVATVSDPHEIVNVLGLQGLDFMLENAEQVPFYFFFGAPFAFQQLPLRLRARH